MKADKASERNQSQQKNLEQLNQYLNTSNNFPAPIERSKTS